MNDEINYKNNPLNGVGLKSLLTEIVDHYGFEILYAYLNLNCFKTNPSIQSSIKFLKKTEWAREKVEIFYLYEFKNLPKASSDQFLLSPRARIIPDHQKPGDPAELTLEDAERLREEREMKLADRGHDVGHRSDTDKHLQNRSHHRNQFDEHDASKSSTPSTDNENDPWGKWKNKSKR